MNKLNKEQLLKTKGGFKLTAGVMTTIVRGANLILELGRSAGTAIRRWQTGRFC